MIELVLVETREKIGLIFFRVNSTEKSICIVYFYNLSIMSCSDVIKSGDECIFEKEVKFNKIITKDIRIRSKSLFVSFVYIIDDTIFIFYGEIEVQKRDVQKICHLFSSFLINTSSTVRIVWFSIVDHKTSGDIVSLL